LEDRKRAGEKVGRKKGTRQLLPQGGGGSAWVSRPNVRIPTVSASGKGYSIEKKDGKRKVEKSLEGRRGKTHPARYTFIKWSLSRLEEHGPP